MRLGKSIILEESDWGTYGQNCIKRNIYDGIVINIKNQSLKGLIHFKRLLY